MGYFGDDDDYDETYDIDGDGVLDDVERAMFYDEVESDNDEADDSEWDDEEELRKRLRRYSKSALEAAGIDEDDIEFMDEDELQDALDDLDD